MASHLLESTTHCRQTCTTPRSLLMRRSGTLAPTVLLALCSLALMHACATLRLVSDYDERTDEQVSALQALVDDTLEALQSSTSPMCLYDNHAQFYKASGSALRSLVIRNQARGQGNEQTIRQLVLLQNSLETLEELHKRASTSQPPACMNANGLAEDRKAINTSFLAILRLELAKKRVTTTENQ